MSDADRLLARNAKRRARMEGEARLLAAFGPALATGLFASALVVFALPFARIVVAKGDSRPAELSITGVDLIRGVVVDGVAIQQHTAAVVALGAVLLGLTVAVPVLLVRGSRPKWFGVFQAIPLLAGFVCAGALFMLRESGIRLAESVSYSGAPTLWVHVAGLLAVFGGLILTATPIHPRSD